MSSHNNCNTLCTFGKKWCDTEVKLHEVNHVWRINNFEFHEADGSTLFSPVLSAASMSEITWRFRLKPNGESEAKDAIGFRLELLTSTVERVYAKVDVSVLNSSQNKVSIRKGKVHTFYQKTGEVIGWGSKNFLKKDDKFRNSILVNDTLTIICEIYFSTVHNAVSNTSHQCNRTLLYPNITDCDLSENLEQLLGDRELADVVLSVDGQEYPAHKNILIARCPVFAAMFKHDMKENEQNRIDIDDMNAETVGEFLKYIYTGKCSTLNLQKIAQDLLVTADKYQLNRLKMICADEMYKNLLVENAASVLALADMHSIEELKREAIKFIVSKRSEVLNTEGWKNIRSNIELVNEVLCSALIG